MSVNYRDILPASWWKQSLGRLKLRGWLLRKQAKAKYFRLILEYVELKVTYLYIAGNLAHLVNAPFLRQDTKKAID
jgi:hypothetical protein